ncbi:hypothetical protein JX265_003749 [Neoarthrinium moseri]|uniref:Zn(2)-C6 fungal-type domain-containing protein n=1 Tax=Neoarthrinium moseri TaxID=1658444 RepID=A0A9P9WSR8_9PEZI|nr:hypothetical protein JX266_009909 [Neoarthrinium moseri]KAI1877741.1 hypothetical protein JX265_003749 [Neoarthrinium moseri]
MLSTITKSYTRRDKKARTGCRQCKQKRVRCDETRPACINCVRKGRVCPGYQVSLSWSTKHEQPTSRTFQRASGPADFEQLASAASHVIHYGAQRGGRTNLDRTSPDAAPILEHCGQDGAGPQTPPFLVSHDDGMQPLAAAITSPIGYYSPPSNTAPPPLVDALTPVSMEYPYDFDMSTASVVADTGWVSDDGYSSIMTSPPTGTPAVPSIPFSCPDQLSVLDTPTAGLVHLPTFLVQHWFDSVCRHWSAFDSENNPVRSMAASLWGSSRIVFYSLQNMSAAALVEYMPDVKEIASSAPALAVEAISEELTELYTSDAGITQFPKGLMLGLICMGSSMCWDDPQKTGAHFYRQARKLMRHYKLRSDYLSHEDRQLLEFFGGCMKYEKMLRDVIGEQEDKAIRTSSCGERRQRKLSIAPHAWTGVSPDLLGLFGDAMSLCQRECARRREQTMTRESYKVALDAIDEAQILEEALLAVELTDIQSADQQWADATRWTHLCDTTEAYRVASLLQLYQTFPDLIARRIPGQVGPDGLVPNGSWLLPLALHLITILQRTPSNSDLRCVQPLLYLSAGSCLRFDDIPVSPARLGCTAGDITGLSAIHTPGSLVPLLSSTYLSQKEDSMAEVLDVSRARSLVTERLEQLEHLLPPKPIRTAKQLMKDTWEVFDAEISPLRKTHWLDVMASTGLKTLFG